MHPGFDPQPNGDGTAVFVFFVRAVGAVDLFVDLPGSSGIYTRLPTTINRLDRTTIVLLRVLYTTKPDQHRSTIVLMVLEV